MQTAWTGEFQHNLMSQAAGGVAQGLGATPETVEKIMNSTDLASGALSLGGGIAAGTRAAGRKTLETATRQVDEVAEASAEQTARVTRQVPNLARKSAHIDELVENGTKQTADEVNSAFPAGYQPPYKPGTEVTEFLANGKADFVRVYGENSPKGGWVMKESDIVGLNPTQIQDKFALPARPTHVIDVRPPAGTGMRTGTVNPIFGGSGGAQQFEFLERVNDGWGVGRPL